MLLHGHPFGNVCDASGWNNILPVGYPFHRWLSFVPGYSTKGLEFVTKTVTVDPRVGNMPLRNDGLTPREWFAPRCIYIDWRKKVILNAVGLSNCGVEFYLKTGVWQKLTEPFRLSLMLVRKTHEARREECREFVSIMRRSDNLPSFHAAIVLQLNDSCPNLGQARDSRDDEAHVKELLEYLEILAELHLPIEVKFGATTPPAVAVEVSKSPHCSCVNGINTVPFGELTKTEKFPQGINWRELFGMNGEALESPLTYRVGLAGGLSGPHIKPVALWWLREVGRLGCHKPMVGGGGITSADDIRKFNGLVDGVSLGCIGILAPWNLKTTIALAHEVFDGREKSARERKLPAERALV
jgi:dihydroorotate dehydrogenase